MIAALAMAAVVAAPVQSSATGAEMARELETTGRIECPLSDREGKLHATTLARIKARNYFDGQGYYPVTPVFPACAVIAFKVDKAGRPFAGELLRYKAVGSPKEALAALRHFHFQPSNRVWNGLLTITVRYRTEDVAKKAAEWRAAPQAATAAASSN
jgi:hypothetical protein